MTRRLLPLFTVAAAIAVMAIPALAKNNSSNSLDATLDLYSTATVNNTKLTPGQYRVIAEGNQAKFEKDGKTVAEVPCTIKTLPSKASSSEFVMDHNQLTEIQVAGKTAAIDFSSSGNSGN